ncbi:unnamed protein product, partial [Mesorhabditis spiculigera]
MGEDCATACKAKGLQLPSIHSAKENEKIRVKMATTKGCNQTHLGMTFKVVSNAYVNYWRDGSAIDYKNWEPGQPSYRFSPDGQNRYTEPCTVMCSGLFEIYLHLLLPDFFFPVFGLTCYGPLGGLDSTAIGIIFATVLMLLLTGIASCFIYRHRQVLPAGHWARPRPRILVAILVFQWVLCSAGLGVGGWMMPYTQDLTGSGMQLILRRHPSYRFLLDVPGLWILDDTDKGLQLAASIFLVTLIYVSLTFTPAVRRAIPKADDPF